MQYMYQVRDTITIDKKILLQEHRFKISQIYTVKREKIMQYMY